METTSETYYALRANGLRMPQRFDVEFEAISMAQKMIASGKKCTVDIMETYGNERSSMMVWPEVGRANAVAK